MTRQLLANPGATDALASKPNGASAVAATDDPANDRDPLGEASPAAGDGATIPLDPGGLRTTPLNGGSPTGALTSRLASRQQGPGLHAADSEPTAPLATTPNGAETAPIGSPTTDAANALTAPLAGVATNALTGDLPEPPPDLIFGGRGAAPPAEPPAAAPAEPAAPAAANAQPGSMAPTAAISSPSGVTSTRLTFEPDFMFADPDSTTALPPARSGTQDFGAATVPLPRQTGTVSLPDGAVTAALAGGEDGIGPVDPAITTPQPGEDAAITELREQVAREPNDADLLFKLSVHLHRAEQTEAARATLTRLAKVYESRGQTAQANRILGMLSSPKTGPIATEDLPPRPRLKTGTLTGSLAPLETGRLGLTGGLGRAVKELPTKPTPPAFPPEALTFTIPLPGEEELDEPLRSAIAQSTDDLLNGRLTAAFDACVWAVHLDDTYHPAFIRMAEINTALRRRRRARSQAESLARLLKTEGDDRHLWMVYRILLHTAENDLPSLRRLVELLIEAERTDPSRAGLASYYASKLIQLLDQEGLTDEAIAYSARLRSLIPGDTRAALEAAILRIKGGDPNGAVDVWEEAVAAGADPILGKASLAAVIAASSPEDHWRILAEVATAVRERKDRETVDAYARTAAVMGQSPELAIGHGVLLANLEDPAARDLLAGVVADRAAPPLAKAIGAVALSRLARAAGPPEEFVASVRTSLKFLEDAEVANHPSWSGLVSITPRYEDLSLELGELLLERQDAAGAVDVLKAAKDRAPKHERICEMLADAYFKTGQLAAALTVLDELVGHHRANGRLEAMAAVLRQMSQLAPNNIKVKTRLIDAYLQRGFVAEARAELIQRADLEERSGLIQDAIASLVRAAELSWTTGMAEETFALYKRVIAMQPNAVEHRHGVVAYYLQLHRTSEAAEHQRAIVDISLREGRRHEAIAALHQVIGLTPDDTSAYYQLGDLLSSVGEYGQAERVYRRILALQPDDPIAQAKATAMASLKEQRAR